MVSSLPPPRPSRQGFEPNTATTAAASPGIARAPRPKGRLTAGYYTGRPVPGATGPAIIVAHVDSKTGPAVFARLRDLKPGDEVTVTRTDHSDVIFVIDRVESHPKNAFPTSAVYDATPDATLRLITCGGSFDRATGHYRANTIAFAHFKALVPHTAGVA